MVMRVEVKESRSQGVEVEVEVEVEDTTVLKNTRAMVQSTEGYELTVNGFSMPL